MTVSLKVLFVIAEMAPLVKVGGLGDVGAGLPRALRRLHHDVRVALPFYAAIDREGLSLQRVASLPEGARVWRTAVRDVPTYLVEHGPPFGREQVYGYDDDPARFLAFCDALLASADALDWQPNLVHLHDWHAGLLATRLVGASDHAWAAAARMLTIHNLGHAGAFDEAFARQHGLAARALATPSGLAPELAYSALAQGILHADLITTVSPTYAREILTPEFGGELAPLLRHCREQLVGVLNGIDVEEYNPARDPHLAVRFDSEQLDRRVENKRALQRQLGLPVQDDAPMLGMVSRLFWQKGSDLAVEAIDRLLAHHRFQFVVLGQGEAQYEAPLAELAARHPEHVAVRLEFDHALGQLIYGGCDLFLMPSRYEPCGLGQFISMRYGAVPVVRRTGGLADSVEPYDEAAARGTGFVFEEASPAALAKAIERALAAHHDRAAWRRLQRRCMAQDWSWGRSARQYAGLYRRAVELRAAAALAMGEER